MTYNNLIHKNGRDYTGKNDKTWFNSFRSSAAKLRNSAPQHFREWSTISIILIKVLSVLGTEGAMWAIL